MPLLPQHGCVDREALVISVALDQTEKLRGI